MPGYHKPNMNTFCLAWRPLKTQESPQRSIQKDPPQHTLPLADWWALQRKISQKFAIGTRGEEQTVIAKERTSLPVEAFK